MGFKKESSENLQDLKTIKRKISIMEAIILILVVILLILSWRYFRLFENVNKLVENLNLLIDLKKETADLLENSHAFQTQFAEVIQRITDVLLKIGGGAPFA